MIVTQHYDLVGHVSAHTVRDAKAIERFSAELLQNADGTVLSFDQVTQTATISASNGVWRYKMLEGHPGSKTLTGTLINANPR